MLGLPQGVGFGIQEIIGMGVFGHGFERGRGPGRGGREEGGRGVKQAVETRDWQLHKHGDSVGGVRVGGSLLVLVYKMGCCVFDVSSRAGLTMTPA